MQVDYRDSTGLRRNRMRVGQFLCWLCGTALNGSQRHARLMTSLVPEGLEACSAKCLGRAVERAARVHQADPATLLRFVFSRLSRHDEAKARSNPRWSSGSPRRVPRLGMTGEIF